MTKRILIVDDSPLVLAAAQRALSDAGFEVETRGGVTELIASALTGFDLILMDVQMPELYGDDVAMVLRNERALATPIYLLSTLDAHELDERARAAGIDGHISKQAGVDHLVAEVRRILA